MWERERLSGKIAWFLLLPFSCVFFIAVHIRNFLFSMNWRRALALERPVISIGNLTVGGTGKTPSCLWLAEELARRGLKVAVLSRGHKRNAVQPVILCPKAHGSLISESADDVAAVGDEPFMMARLYGQTVGIGKERYRVAQELMGKSEVDVFVLDDGFQHRQLKRDIDLVLLGSDSTGWLLPSGPFREPRRALRRADYFLLTGTRENWKPLLDSVANGACFTGALEAVALVGFESNQWKDHPLTLLYRSRILAVTGIANPDGFYRFIRDYEGEIVDILEQNGMQLQKLIEDLLNFHLAEARLAALDLQPLQLDRMLEDVLNDHKLAMRAKDIEVQLVAAPMVVRGDREKLRIAIDNLVSNAVKYSMRGGTIRAALTHEAGDVILDISDTGPGIADEDKPRVFEAFYQGAAAYEGHVKGSGLGLAIAREYVAAHHGQLEIVDDVSQGAHFRLTLPTSNSKETA